MSVSMDYFLCVALQGFGDRATQRQVSAKLLAQTIITHSQALDGESLRGLHEWIDFCARDQYSAGDLFAGGRSNEL